MSSEDTDRRQKFPLPWWALALILLGVSGGSVSALRSFTPDVPGMVSGERVRALEVRVDGLDKRLEKIDSKLDLILERLRH